jgi:hypothetical protein
MTEYEEMYMKCRCCANGFVLAKRPTQATLVWRCWECRKARRKEPIPWKEWEANG